MYTFNNYSEAAVRETYGAKPLCEERLGIKMHDLVLHSTAKNFSKRTKSAAKSCVRFDAM